MVTKNGMQRRQSETVGEYRSWPAYRKFDSRSRWSNPFKMLRKKILRGKTLTIDLANDISFLQLVSVKCWASKVYFLN